MIVKGERWWQKIVLSDKSRFTLDGSDGLSAYWSDSCRPGRWHSTRRNLGGGVMVWGCFSFYGLSQLVFIEGNIDSPRYCTVLEDAFLLFIKLKHPRSALLQQENAPCHTSAYTRQGFADTDVRVIDWPSRSPDLNPIENIRGMMAQKVYYNGRQYDCIDDLKESLTIAWDNIKEETVQKLVESMPRRLLSVIEKRGAPTSC